jgi:hypothetical protein
MMKKKLQVFVSSTYLDLVKERQSAVEAILELGHIPAGMELFNAGNDTQLEIIKKWIEESDIFMLILGARYGTLEHNSQLSYTHLEYLYALELGKPFFTLYIDEKIIEERKSSRNNQLLEIENPDKYIIFKELVMSKICAVFEDHKDIKYRTAQTLKEFEGKYEYDGWVSGKEIKKEVLKPLKSIKIIKDFPTPNELLITDKNGIELNPTLSYESSNETFMELTYLPVSFWNVNANVRLGYHPHGEMVFEVCFSDYKHVLDMIYLTEYLDDNGFLTDGCLMQVTTYDFNQSGNENIIIAISHKNSYGRFWVFSYTNVENIGKINPLNLELSKSFQSKIIVDKNELFVPLGSQGSMDLYAWFGDSFYTKCWTN